MIRYIADLHFDHESIIAYDNRPFDSLEEMNEKIIENWNSVVTDPEDRTWILGDFCTGGTGRWAEVLNRLQGHKSLIKGNHDDPSVIEKVRHLFEDVADYREILDQDRHVVLSHYPIFAFRDHYFGGYHLYGHVHRSYEWNIAENAKRLLRNLYVREDICRMGNAGAMMVYMDYRPRSLDELIAAGVL